MTIAATIQAAEIQKLGTLWGSAIGGLSLAIGVWASWCTGLSLQKRARLGELRRDVYLEFSESYSNFITEIELTLSNLGSDGSNLLKQASMLRNKIDKTLFVCETKNKETIYTFSQLLTDKTEEFIEEIRPLKSIFSELSNLLVEREKVRNQIYEIVKSAGLAINIENNHNNDQGFKEYFNELRKNARDLVLESERLSTQLEEQAESKIEYIRSVVSLLNKDFLSLAHKLRSEVGIKNDVNLDNKLYNQYKSKPN